MSPDLATLSKGICNWKMTQHILFIIMFYFTLNSVTWHVYCFCINDGTENTRSTENKAHLQKTSGAEFVDPRQTDRQAGRQADCPECPGGFGLEGSSGITYTLLLLSRDQEVGWIPLWDPWILVSYQGWHTKRSGGGRKSEKVPASLLPPFPDPWGQGHRGGGGGGRCQVPGSH